MSENRAQARRSRHGCSECRRRHRKCSETKPICSNCIDSGRLCVYNQSLSWGGRPFKKSRFGKCLDARARRVESSDGRRPDGDFVYGVLCPIEVTRDDESGHRPRPDAVALHSLVFQPETEIRQSQPDRSRDLLRDSTFLSVISAVTGPEQLLLSYFLDGMTKVISCHSGIQKELCSALLPMALATPHLLAAILALAEAHRLSAGLQTNYGAFEHWKSKSIRLLRPAIATAKQSSSSEAILATTLVLCTAEIASPTTAVADWRIHLRGAGAVLAASSSRFENAILYRQYRAFQGVALACGIEMENFYDLIGHGDWAPNLDDLAGFSSHLFPIFRAINNLSTLREDVGFTCPCPPEAPHLECMSPVMHQSHILFDQVRSLLEGRKSGSNLPDQVRLDFELLDEAYHHLAILQIHVHGSLSVPLSLYHESKSRLLDSLSAIDYDQAPCPGVAALPPLFVAGCLASDQAEQKVVRTILRKLWVNFSMGNVPPTKRFLEKLWLDRSGRGRCSSGAYEAVYVLSKTDMVKLETLPY